MGLMSKLNSQLNKDLIRNGWMDGWKNELMVKKELK
jgi:hypothetical protein